MQTLVNALAQELSGEVRTSCTVTQIEKTDEGFRVTTDNGDPIDTRAVILTVPAYVAADLVEPLHNELARDLRTVRYTSTATASLAYKRTELPTHEALNGVGILIPEKERRGVMACTWSSNKFAGRAPDDQMLMRLFLEGDAADQPDDSDIVASARSELNRLIGVTEEPVFHRVCRWQRSNPQYEVGHLDRVARMEQTASTIPGLYLSGSAYRGIGIPDCIRQAKQTVEQIANALL